MKILQEKVMQKNERHTSRRMQVAENVIAILLLEQLNASWKESYFVFHLLPGSLHIINLLGCDCSLRLLAPRSRCGNITGAHHSCLRHVGKIVEAAESKAWEILGLFSSVANWS